MIRWILRLLLGCKHDWKVIDKTDMPSPYEQMTRDGGVVKSVESPLYFTKQSTTVIACSACGAMKIVRTRNLTRWD